MVHVSSSGHRGCIRRMKMRAGPRFTGCTHSGGRYWIWTQNGSAVCSPAGVAVAVSKCQVASVHLPTQRTRTSALSDDVQTAGLLRHAHAAGRQTAYDLHQLMAGCQVRHRLRIDEQRPLRMADTAATERLTPETGANPGTTCRAQIQAGNAHRFRCHLHQSCPQMSAVALFPI